MRQTWGEYRVFFYDEQGALKAVPASWTDVGEVDAFVSVAGGRAHFRPADLVQLVTLVARLREQDNGDQGE